MGNAERRAVAGILAAAALVLPSLARAADRPRAAPHAHFLLPESCPGCHLADRDGRPDPDRLSPDADALCLGCHRQEGMVRTHPVGIRPADVLGRDRVPGDLRLADDGRMLCLTCHTGHGPFLAATRAFPRQAPEEGAAANGPRFRSYFLRRSGPERGAAPLCEACHRMPR